MARPARSPVLGFNHNVRYHGRIYHVQTEDSGPGKSRIFTHLFHEGSILASKRLDYEETLTEGEVRAHMQAMHKGILKDLKRGVHDEKIIEFFTAMGQDPFLDQVAAAAPDALMPDEDSGDYADVAMTGGDAEVMPQYDTGGPELDEQVLLADLSADLSDTDAVELPEMTSPPPSLLQPPIIRLTSPMPSAPRQPGQPAPPIQMQESIILDLDALPPVEDTPEPGPMEPARPTSAPPASYSPTKSPGGVGVYVRRGGGSERPFAPRTPPPAGQGQQRPQGPQAYGQAYPRVPQAPGTRPPVVVIRPPPRVAPGARQRVTTSVRQAPPGGVVVQRTVVVGVGGGGPNAQRPRRPRPAVPYVVKEGSHPIARNPRAAQVAPPIQQRPVPPTSPLRRSNPPPAATISDKSLDEVILAYLSQDDK